MGETTGTRKHDLWEAATRNRSIREACREIGVSKTTLYKMRARGQIEFVTKR